MNINKSNANFSFSSVLLGNGETVSLHCSHMLHRVTLYFMPDIVQFMFSHGAGGAAQNIHNPNALELAVRNRVALSITLLQQCCARKMRYSACLNAHAFHSYAQ